MSLCEQLPDSPQRCETILLLRTYSRTITAANIPENDELILENNNVNIEEALSRQRDAFPTAFCSKSSPARIALSKHGFQMHSSESFMHTALDAMHSRAVWGDSNIAGR